MRDWRIHQKRHPDKIWYNQVMWCWCMTTTSRLTSINRLNPLNWGRCEIFWWNLTTYGDLKIHPSLVNSSKTIIQAPVIVSNLSWVFARLGWLKSSTSWVISLTEVDTLRTLPSTRPAPCRWPHNHQHVQCIIFGNLPQKHLGWKQLNACPICMIRFRSYSPSKLPNSIWEYLWHGIRSTPNHPFNVPTTFLDTPRCARRPRLDANSPSVSPYLVSQPPPDTAAALWDGEVLKRTGNVARRSQIGKMSSFFSASNWSTFLFWIDSKHLIFEVWNKASQFDTHTTRFFALHSFALIWHPHSVPLPACKVPRGISSPWYLKKGRWLRFCWGNVHSLPPRLMCSFCGTFEPVRHGRSLWPATWLFFKNELE